MNFFFRTLGCKMNWLDTARISAAIDESGHTVVNREEEADYIVVNTCTVTAEADRKSHQSVNAAGRLQKRVAVIGCGPKVEEGGWAAESGQTQVFGHENQLLEHLGIDTERLPFPLTSRTRLPIAIQHGCDNPCSFCITRIARGSHHSVESRVVVEQIKRAQDHAIREVVLTGINLAAWGCSDSRKAEQSRLPELLEQILKETSIERVRLSSLGPEYLHGAFFDIYNSERICDYLHLSVQSGSEEVLQRMQRGYGVERLHQIAKRAREVRPHSAIACDMITGFPGEGEEAFQQTVQFSREVAFARMHIFPFSPRPGTEAASLSGGNDNAIRKGRAKELRKIAQEMRQRFIESQIGKEHYVLVESGGSGLSSNYIRVAMEGHPEGEVVSLRLTSEQAVELL